MSEIPDSVIEQAVEAGAEGLTDRGLRAKPVNGRIEIDSVSVAAPVVAAAAPVIAKWAREQERDRIKSLIEARAREAADDYRRDPQAYHRGREDELVTLADELAAAGKDGEA